MYIELLEKYKQEFNFKLFAYVLLPQHLHLLIEPSREVEISDIMRALNTSYSKYFNSAHNRRGHLFRERFRACIVEKDAYLPGLVAYIHRNPLRLGLVSSIDEYKHSNYYLYKEGVTDYPEVKEVLGCIEGNYLDYVSRIKEEEQLHKRLQRGGTLGSKDFVKKIREEIDALRQANKQQPPASKKLVLISSIGTLLLVLGLISVIRFLMPQKIERFVEQIQGASFTVREIKDLNNTEWEIELIPHNTADSAFRDTLSFVDGKFISARFVKEGAKPTNYTVMQEADFIIWETLQSFGNTTVSWRGEIERDTMQGIVSLRIGDDTQDFSFVSIRQRRKK